MNIQENLFYLDRLGLIMSMLVGFVGICVASFASRYLKGDRKQRLFYLNLLALLASVFIMVNSNHLFLLFISWTTSNFFLTRLMLHKREWAAARQSSWLALKNFSIGSLMIGSGFFCLYYATGETSIYKLLRTEIPAWWLFASSSMIFVAAMTQSGLWPFHRWLTSSLNAPTPTSALMHAGLVNGGGFLLTRFAPLFLQQPTLLNVIFLLGIVSALLGTLWKLMQSDVKRMLACSTMGQMGFMIAQCGLGLFPAAIAHLCWHGLFKAFLFLSSGSAAQEKRLDLEYPPTVREFLLALFCGTVGAWSFSISSNKPLLAGDTNIFLILVALIASTQCAISLLRGNSRLPLLQSLICTIGIGAFYGLSVRVIGLWLAPLDIAGALPLNMLHWTALATLSLAWLAILFGRHPNGHYEIPEWVLRIYVRMLNASQPHPDTITTHRNQYRV